MRVVFTATLVASLVFLAGCQPHPPLRYVDHEQIAQYRTDHVRRHRSQNYRNSSSYRSWRRHQAEIRGDMSYHNGCYRGWCR